MKEPAREGLLVDGAGAPLAEEDSGSLELRDGTSVAYHTIAPDNASAPQRFHHRLSERSIYLRFFAAKPKLSDREDALDSLSWEEGEVLVVGSRRLGRVAGVFLGSNTTKIVLKSPVPVLVIPRGADVRLQDAAPSARGFEQEQ